MFKIEHLTFRYSNQVIWRDYSSQLLGNIYLYGPNGCGKTTLLKLLSSVLMPQEGTILWNDSPSYRASSLLNTKLLYDDIPLDKQLRWICSLARQDYNWLLSRGEGLALEPLLPLTPQEMSQGMRQWATLAFVCVMPADVYLLDEPLVGLDACRCRQFHDYLKTRISQGDSFIITGHDADGMSEFPELKSVEFQRGTS